jgi:hypothetical protein
LARRKLDGWNPSWCGFCNALKFRPKCK